MPYTLSSYKTMFTSALYTKDRLLGHDDPRVSITLLIIIGIWVFRGKQGVWVMCDGEEMVGEQRG